MVNKKIALVTGASSGLGASFARAIAKEGKVDEIWLCARRADRLATLAQDLSCPSRLFVGDVSDPAWQASLTKALNEPGEARALMLLINNAGLGKTGLFSDLDPGHVEEVMEVNMKAPTQLLHQLLPYMKRGGRVINVASVAAFLPQPGFALYAASKAYLLSLSRALDRELAPKGITITACCPNPMETEFFDKSGGIGPTGLKRMGLDQVDQVVQTALRQSRKGKALSLTHPTAKAVHVISHLLPHSFLLWAEKKIGFY